MIRSFLLLGVLLAAAGAAPAQTPPAAPPENDARFSYHRSDDGFVRLDQRTGDCARRTSGWSCLMTPDDRAALEAEIGRLQSENGALKKALLDRSLPLPAGSRPEPPTAGALQGSKPGDAEVDRVMSIVERIWRRLIEMMANLRRDLNKT